MTLFRCPLCGGSLSGVPAGLRCPRGHCFDRAKEGYVNLLPVGQKHSKAPGDDKAMVAARREDSDKIRGLGLGADEYIEKPFSPSVLGARVRAHLARYERLTGGQRKAKPNLRAGGLRMNTETRRVFADGQEVDLKNKEYELLQFLMLHMDIVFSREELYENIWGLEAMGDNATVAVHINRVREKIEPDPSHPRYLQTVWGAGYRFKGQ